MQARSRRVSAARVAGVLCAVAAGVAALASGAAASPLAHGHVIQILKPGLGVNASQSTNWFGYNQGALAHGNTLYHSIAGNWTVPTATQHSSGQAESSSDWIGIGGGCIDSGCTVGDSTLIQTGTEQDVDSSGKASYSAWYELVPAPSIGINMTVAPGDRMQASIAETVPSSNVWVITLKDTTRGETFSTTLPYSSSHLTAEWIEETPIVLGSSGAGFAALPNLTDPAFDLGTTNGAPAGLTSSDEVQLTNSSGSVIGTPSAPDSDTDGFGACAWATSCSAPGS